jgi:50S ribosomal protein L16 3-hydroxylase
MKMILPSDLHQLLGGLSPAVFLKKYWQKKPLLIRRAFPGFTPPVTRAEMFELAGRDEVESRIVAQQGRAWSMERGPFSKRQLKRAPGEKWSLLVQGVNLHSRQADALLGRFDFVPRARLDDLMISWAADGGGVGPHFDSYDVFLLQAQGQRRWRVSMQRDRSLLPDAPLKILSRFKPTEEYVLDPGDMLYLPPGAAHDGVAVGECMTCSIGFRAPAAAELARGFLEYLADQMDRPGRYADPGLKPAADTALIDDGMVARAAKLAWPAKPSRAEFEKFLGLHLTEPKSNVFFNAPDQPTSTAAFARTVAKHGLVLDLQTQLLHRGKQAYINGEAQPMPTARTDAELVRALARARQLPPVRLPAAVAEIFHAWYEYGWLHAGETR